MTRSHEQMERRERAILDALPLDAEHVPDAEHDGWDARLTEPFTATDDLHVVGRLTVPAGTPVELKTCQVWIDDAGSRAGRRRGTFRIQRDTHEQLAAADGVYCLLVMDGDDVVHGRLLDADMVEQCVSSWTNGGAKYRSERAHLSWGSVIPTDAVEGGVEA